MLQNGSEKKKDIASLKHATYEVEEKGTSIITNVVRGGGGERTFLPFWNKWRGYLKCWRDYLILGSVSPASLPGPSGDRRALYSHGFINSALQYKSFDLRGKDESQISIWPPGEEVWN